MNRALAKPRVLHAYAERAASIAEAMARYAIKGRVDGLRNGGRALAGLGRELADRLGAPSAERICNVCGWRGSVFAPRYYYDSYREDVRCYQCGCTDRCRLTALYLEQCQAGFFEEKKRKVLDIGPLWYTRHFFPDQVDYVSFDLSSPVAMVQGDLCKAPFLSGAFDMWLCFHVLDHIPDDARAMRELRRLLSPTGFGLLDHVIDWSAPTVEYNEARRVGGVGPLRRRYGRDLPDRLRAAGFTVDVLDSEELFDEATRRLHAIHPRRFLLCRPETGAS